jgi:hypothetical protein
MRNFAIYDTFMLEKYQKLTLIMENKPIFFEAYNLDEILPVRKKSLVTPDVWH